MRCRPEAPWWLLVVGTLATTVGPVGATGVAGTGVAGTGVAGTGVRVTGREGLDGERRRTPVERLWVPA